MRRIVRFTCAVWLSVAATFAVFFLFWRLGYVRPHAFWAAASILLIGASTIGLLTSALWRLSRGPQRLRALGWLLTGITPLVWFGAYFTDLNIRADTREALNFNATMRTIVTWASSIMDLEARWRYSRWLPGEHTLLIDDGQTPDAERLVAEMDEHIRSMADLLGKPVPAIEFPWVRGPLVGHSGKAVFLWALCGHEDNPARLTYLDRHEVAHTFITALAGVDQYPPLALAEGWAESQSKERDQLLIDLVARHESGSTYTLQELVGQDWYTVDNGPVYWEGGPLVIYLMEHYGPEKFLELYAGVRPATFHADCEAILGDSWEAVEEAFWPWLKQEGERIAAAAEATGDEETINRAQITLGENVNPDEWQEFLESYRSTRTEDESVLPQNVAFITSIQRTDTMEEQGIIDQATEFEFQAVFEKNSFWIFENYSRHHDLFLKLTPGESAKLYGDDLKSLQGRVGTSDRHVGAREAAENLLRLFSGMNEPGDLLPISNKPGLAGSLTIQELTKQPSDGDRWMLAFNGNHDDWGFFRYELELDPKLDWLITAYRYSNEAEGPWKSEAETSYRRIGTGIMPAVFSSHHLGKGKDYTAVKQEWRELTSEEIKELKQRVERAVAVGPAKPRDKHRWLRQMLMATVIGCPLWGVALVKLSPSTSDESCPEKSLQSAS